MRQLWYAVLLAALTVSLCACAPAQTTFETVDDELPAGTLADAPCTIVFTPPDGVVALEPQDTACRVYESSRTATMRSRLRP